MKVSSIFDRRIYIFRNLLLLDKKVLMAQINKNIKIGIAFM